VMEAAVLARLEASWDGRTPEQRSAAWMARQMQKIDRALEAMSSGLAEKAYCSGVYFSLSDVAVGCALGYLEFRFPEIAWRQRHPNLARLQDKLALRPSFAEIKAS